MPDVAAYCLTRASRLKLERGQWSDVLHIWPRSPKRSQVQSTGTGFMPTSTTWGILSRCPQVGHPLQR